MDHIFPGLFLKESNVTGDAAVDAPEQLSRLQRIQFGDSELHREYHVSLHPRAKLDGVGETEGKGWVGEGSMAANFSLICLALNLDFVPSEEEQKKMQSFCSSVVYLRALFEPTVLLFGIPGNLVAIQACLGMSPLRPASIFLALISFGDLCALISNMLPMEGSYFLEDKEHVNYYWFTAFEAVATAFPHYALVALNIERASTAWRPVFSNRLITVLGAKIISVSLFSVLLLSLPLVAEAASSEFVRTSMWELDILVFGSIVPGFLILLFNVVMVVGLLTKYDVDGGDESITSQISIIMPSHSLSHHDFRWQHYADRFSRYDRASRGVFRQTKSEDMGTAVDWNPKQQPCEPRPSRPSPPSPSHIAGENVNRSAQEEPAEPKVLAVLGAYRDLFTVWADDADFDPNVQVSESRSDTLSGLSSREESIDSTGWCCCDGGGVEDRRCKSLRDHSSLTRMSVLASAAFFLMEWPLTIVSLVYDSARGQSGDATRPVQNPLTMLRLLYLYELFAWISSVQKGIKLYLYLLAAPRFRNHFIFTMMRHARGGGGSQSSRDTTSQLPTGLFSSPRSGYVTTTVPSAPSFSRSFSGGSPSHKASVNELHRSSSPSQGGGHLSSDFVSRSRRTSPSTCASFNTAIMSSDTGHRKGKQRPISNKAGYKKASSIGYESCV